MDLAIRAIPGPQHTMTQAPRLLLTPTPRLARALARETADARRASGESAWLPPRVMTFQGLYQTLADEYFLAASDPRTPISTSQALVLWQSIIDHDVFIGEPEVANMAQRAWRAIHEHALDAPEAWLPLLLTEDARRMQLWAADYRALCERERVVDPWAFATELPHLLRTGAVDAPPAIELVGFDLPLTPLERAVANACARVGCRVTEAQQDADEAHASPNLIEFEDEDHELRGAARWARTQLETMPDARLAVVVTDLSGRVSRVERIFAEVLDPPSHALRDTTHEPLWHISLGAPLASWPLVADALAVLDLDGARLRYPATAMLLRSPYLGGWQLEHTARSNALAYLTARAPYFITVNELLHALEGRGGDLQAESLRAWQRERARGDEPAWPAQWSSRFAAELAAIGLGRGRSLDSREYQALMRWHSLLEELAALDAVVPAKLSRAQALAQISQRAAATIFREQNPGTPIEILGVNEALGSRFDATWITTLDGDTWPGPLQRDPLIPSPVQDELPRATTTGCIAQAERELQGLRRTAPSVVGSYSTGTEEVARERSGMLHDWPSAEVPDAAPMTSAPMDQLADDALAPAFDGNAATGGTGLLRDQSACPFRAFANRRLRAKDLTPPRPGLSPMQRGDVVHDALEHFWTATRDRETLANMSAQGREAAIEAAVSYALDNLTRTFRLTLSRSGRGLELARAKSLLGAWLDAEAARPDFRVIACEADVDIRLGELNLTGTIDRMDELEDGSRLIIDYKSGRTSKSAWAPEARIPEPQLPAYAVTARPQPNALAFAQLRPDALRLDGLSDRETDIAGIGTLSDEGRTFRELDDWHELIDTWHEHIRALAVDFATGVAHVEPRAPEVCRTCHLRALCRVSERAPYDALAEDDDD